VYYNCLETFEICNLAQFFMTTTMTISTSLVWLPVYRYMENKVNEWMNDWITTGLSHSNDPVDMRYNYNVWWNLQQYTFLLCDIEIYMQVLASLILLHRSLSCALIHHINTLSCHVFVLWKLATLVYIFHHSCCLLAGRTINFSKCNMPCPHMS
jgi:hypothetical protein